jgi:hypothetical protein
MVKNIGTMLKIVFEVFIAVYIKIMVLYDSHMTALGSFLTSVPVYHTTM